MNLSYKVDGDRDVYATWSEGYRPGGINRDPHSGDFLSDFLTNWELGWKTRWADDRLQFNGAVFLEEWDDIQVAFQGDNGITRWTTARAPRSPASKCSSTGCRPTTSVSAAASRITTAS